MRHPEPRLHRLQPRPLGDSIYTGTCDTTGIPGNVRIIDELNSTVPLGPEGCVSGKPRGGSFALTFPASTNAGHTIYPSKVDLHQIGSGFGGHFWFTHTRDSNSSEATWNRVTGRWTIDPTNAWTRVLVHIPDNGAWTQQAHYQIHLPSGTVKDRVIPTRYEANTWVDLGVYDFTGSGTPYVELTNVTKDGGAYKDIAWDALAVQPLPAKPKHFIATLGDSYTSGEGAGSYTHVSNQYGDDPSNRDACRRSRYAWSRLLLLPGAGWTTGFLADTFDPNMDFRFVACSGARTYNLASQDPNLPWVANSPPPAGQYGELPQIDQGALDTDTTLVLLSIGGNDAGFTKEVRACLLTTDCTGDGTEARLQGEIVNTVAPRIQRLVQEIRAKAPTATIVFVGYPKLFEPGVSYLLPDYLASTFGTGLSSAETDMLGRLAVYMNDHALPSDSAHKVWGMSAVTGWTGHSLRQFAVIQSPDTYLNGLSPYATDTSPNKDGEESSDPGRMSNFHPNEDGTHLYSQLIADYLNAILYRW